MREPTGATWKCFATAIGSAAEGRPTFRPSIAKCSRCSRSITTAERRKRRRRCFLQACSCIRLTFCLCGLSSRVAPTWTHSRLQRGPHTGRGAKPAGLVGDRTRLTPVALLHNARHLQRLFGEQFLVVDFLHQYLCGLK